MASTFPTSPHGPDERPAGWPRSFPETRAPERPPQAPRIWALGGGKGGVGKSVVASNLAAALAGRGRRCALVDADLGAANLHTLLGVSRPRHTLSHLLGGEIDSLADLMVQTSVPNLWLVSGDQALLEMANPRHGQKELLFRHIRSLDVDEVLLDLGAGSAFNVLDFFLLARRRLVVVSPEPTAIENAEHFVAAAFHRSLRDVARQSELRSAILRVREGLRGRRVRSVRELIDRVREIDPPGAKLLEGHAQAFAPLLLVNQVQNTEQRRAGSELAAACRQRLGVSIRFAGSLDSDPGVPEAVARRQPALQLFPGCRFSRSVQSLAELLVRDEWEPPQPQGDGRDSSCRSHRAEPRGPLPPLDLTEPGAYLRRCREQLGLSLDEMTERTRIRGLGPIEREQFELLPPEPYLKGFVLQYARELGVPQLEDLTASYLGRYRRVGARANGSGEGGARRP